jgi:hypothetical protein
MADARKVLTLLGHAATLLRATPGRQGRLVRLPDTATELMLAGDMHGHVDNFREIHRRADLANNPGRHLQFQEVVHGSRQYPAGGDRSHQLLDLVAAMACQFPGRVHFLPGNHEYAQRYNRRVERDGLDCNELFRQGVATAFGADATAVSAAYDAFIDAAPLAVLTPNRLFASHTIIPPGKLGDFSLDRLRGEPDAEALKVGGWAYCLMWSRDVSEEAAGAFAARVEADWLVTGHIVCEAGHAWANSRQLILDTHANPASCLLVPTSIPLTREAIEAGIQTW